MKKERNIDSMKYRKSTHLAGVDVETMISEKGKCILTIKDAFYERGVDVSGNKTDGYFLEFEEDVKGMVVNSTNRKTISAIAKQVKELTNIESRNIGNWIGLAIELTFDENVKMMGKITGGIRVSPISPIPNISPDKAINKLSESTNLRELQDNWISLSANEKKLPEVNSLKDKLKEELK